MSESGEGQTYTEPQIETQPFEQGELVRYTPKEIRLDPRTGQKIRPLFYVQGINGDNKLPWMLKTLGDEQQREIIAIKYPGKLLGATNKLETVSSNSVVTEMDKLQADEIVALLDTLQIDAVDAVAESRGAIRLITAMATHPTRFKNAYLAHPAGLDDRGYSQSHFDALHQLMHHAARKVLGKVEPQRSEDETPARGGRLLRDPKGWRKEQKSVAHGEVRQALATYATDTGKRIIIAGDKNDKAFLSSRLAENANGQNVTFVETDWGGHGIGYNLNAVKDISSGLNAMESLSSA